MTQTHETLAIAMDLTRDVWGCLPQPRRDDFLTQAKRLTQSLRLVGVPVTYTVFNSEAQDKIFAREESWCSVPPRPKDMIQTILWGLDYFLPKRDEDVVVKTKRDVFENPSFVARLHEAKTKRILLFGTNTSACLLASVQGAVRNGFEVWVAYDCLADVRVRGAEGGAQKESDPLWHKQLIEKRVPVRAKVRVVSAQESLSLLAKK